MTRSQRSKRRDKGLWRGAQARMCDAAIAVCLPGVVMCFETEWRSTGSDSIGEMRGHVGVTRREDVKRSFVVHRGA